MLPFNNDYSFDTNNTYREYRVDTKDQYLKILEFKHIFEHFEFQLNADGSREKIKHDGFNISVIVKI